MNSNEIIKLLSKCDFNENLYSEVIDEKIFNHLPDDFSYNWDEGASKLVIKPYNEDYVIKIPYHGQYHSLYEKFDPFIFANDTRNFYWDYCLTETLTWRLAKIENVHKAFAKERIIGMINGHPIYIQQKVKIYTDSDSYYLEDGTRKAKVRNYCKKKKLNVFYEESLNWQADALEYYGSKQFNKIMSFIKKNNIGDFHSDNLGYIGQRPVFVDYSNYHE